ncbi:hypothetical protein [Streptomyces sp. MS2.AVA.5]|uniref:Uncharacterized protein n=1 Tax=Streptomyces achmelvichensis TaxID=3134111 RepID=A0ACC6PZ51_9ACTN
MTRDRPGVLSRWWLGVRQQHGNTWAQRIIWVLERLDSSEKSSLDRWGSLCAMVPSDDPVARFDMARQLLPSICDVRLPGMRRQRGVVPRRRMSPRQLLRWTGGSLAVFLIGFTVAGYFYVDHMTSGLPSTLTADERKKAIAERMAKDDTLVNVDQLLTSISFYCLAGLGLLLLTYTLGFITWAWVGSGRAVKKAGREKSQ